MFSLKNSGDSLANEFSRIIKKASGVQATIEDTCEGCDEGCDSCQSNPAEDMTLSAEDFLLTTSRTTGEDSVDKALDSTIDSFASSGHKLMSGLGKIASDLRGKGEAFAADMVEATALSISKDLSKEAEGKSQVIENLNKIAKEFDNNGDAFAGDMVRVTIENIIRS
jgi:hypothetical protein